MDEVRRAALDRLFARMSDVASFPAAAQQLLELTANENSSGAEIRDVIQTDPALVANILKRVNSSFYGLANKVTDIRSALSLLGTREIRNMAMTTFLARFNANQSEHGTYRREALWTHCVATGVAARVLAKELGKGVPEEAYMAGLLHDFGYILCDQFLHKHFCQVIDRITPDVPSVAIENEVLTFDHAMLGGFVAEKWQFPDSAVDAITYHHRPQDYHGLHDDTLHLVVLANYLCSEAGYLSLGVPNTPAPGAELLSAIDCDSARLPSLREKVQQAITSAKSLSA
jgi:putative nucleotidyltransferase with HDIG domain